jgi:hypothetical protein
MFLSQIGRVLKKCIEEKKRIGAIFINSMDMFITSFLYYFDKC